MYIIKNTIIFSFLILFLNGFNIKDNWFLYQSKSFGFIIEFPKKPKLFSEETQTDIGTLKLNYITYDSSSINSKDENLTYMVNYIKYPIGKVNSNNIQQLSSIHRNSIDTAVLNTNGKLMSEKIVMITGYKGRDIKVLLPKNNVLMSMRLVLVKNKMYMIQVFSKKNKEFNKSISRFINSFDLI